MCAAGRPSHRRRTNGCAGNSPASKCATAAATRNTGAGSRRKQLRAAPSAPLPQRRRCSGFGLASCSVLPSWLQFILPRGSGGGQAHPFSRRHCARALQQVFTNGLLKKREAERREAQLQLSAPHIQASPPERASQTSLRRLRKPVRRAEARHGPIRLRERPAAGALAFRRSTAAFVAGRTLSTRSRPRFTR